MEVRVLGGGAAGSPWSQAGCLLVDGCLALDAGGLVSQLDAAAQAAIDHVLVSHVHLDHVGELAFLADSVMARRSAPLRIWAPAPVLMAIRTHLFNGVLWPDFGRVRLNGFPVIEFCPLPPEGETPVGHLRVRWAPTNHPVFAAGYLLADAAAAILYTGDTGPTEAVWALGSACPQLQAVFTETSFPDRQQRLALASGHLTPALLRDELAKLEDRNVAVKIMHVKAHYLEEIRTELAPLAGRCQILTGSERFRLPAEIH